MLACEPHMWFVPNSAPPPPLRVWMTRRCNHEDINGISVLDVVTGGGEVPNSGDPERVSTHRLSVSCISRRCCPQWPRAHTHTHTHTHTHDENHKQEQSKKSGERKLLRNCRAALDVFRSVGKGSDVQLRSSGAV